MNYLKSVSVAAVALVLSITGASAQEFVIDSIATGTTPTIKAGTGMNQMLYGVYQKQGSDGKVNMAMLDMMLNPMENKAYDTKGYGVVKAFAQNDQATLFLFYNSTKKAATMVTYSIEGTLLSKKAYKGIGENDYVDVFASLNPESFVIVKQTSSKAGYTVEGIDKDLEVTWSHKSAKNIAEVFLSMDMLNVISVSKNTQGGESYQVTALQTETGDKLADMTLKNEEQLLYPTFFTNVEGMTYTGGLFFKDGNPNSKTPDGVYMAQMGPDGSFSEIVTTPYSLIIEDIKGANTEMLTSGKYKLLPVNSMRKMDGSGMVMICELFSRKNTANGNALFSVMDMVAINYSLEQKYDHLNLISKEKKDINVKGSIVKNSDDWSVAKELLLNGYFDLKVLQDKMGHLTIGYLTKKNNEHQICYTNVNNTASQCSPIGNRLLKGASSTITYNSDNNNTIAPYGILSSNPEAITVYEYQNPQVLLYTLPIIGGDVEGPHGEHHEHLQEEEAPPTNETPEQ